MQRKDIKTEYKWDLSELYPDLEAWDKELESTKPLIEDIKKYKGHLLDSATNLLGFFQDDEKVSYYLERLNFYAFLIVDEDLSNSEVQKRLDIINDVIANYNSVISFVNPELLQSDYEVIETFMDSCPDLRVYERTLKEIFRLKSHMLSSGEEALISEMMNVAQAFQNSSQMIRNMEIDFGYITDELGEEVKLTASNKSKYAKSEDREVRRQVYENEGLGYQSRIDSLATNYVGFIRNFETEARYRKYDSYLDQKLDVRDIDRSVYESLKKVARDNVGIYQKYLQFVKDCLGVEKLESYDLNAPLVKNANKDYSIEEAKDIILSTFECFGDEYVKVLKYAFESRSIDFLPCDNKVTGWYSAYISYGKPKILANYNNKIMDVSSLVHELGHFVNQYMIVENQHPQYVYQSSFCAEVSSLNNEIIFSHKMMDREADVDTKKELLANFIKTFASNFFGAIRQALFEEEAHKLIVEDKGATSKELSQIWQDINDEFNGDLVASSKYSIGWAAIPHYYLGNGFYVFNYSTGIVAATNLAQKLLAEEEGIKEKFYEYLKIGNSMSPLESLGVLGIDMTTTKPYEVALEMFSNAIDEYYKLCK